MDRDVLLIERGFEDGFQNLIVDGQPLLEQNIMLLVGRGRDRVRCGCRNGEPP